MGVRMESFDPFEPSGPRVPPTPVSPFRAHLRTFLDNLEDNANIAEQFVVKDPTQSQAQHFANSLGDALFKVEQCEISVISGGDDPVGDHLLDRCGKLKFRARRLLASCHACIEDTIGGDGYGSAKNSLPKLQLPKFNGEFAKWANFWELFTEIVDARKDLTPVVKFNYLISSLVGEPLDMIEGLPVSSINYQKAKKLLQEKFGNVDKVRQMLIRKFTSIPAPKNNLSDLKQFTNTAKKLLAQLHENTPLDVGEFIKSLLVEKLPKSVYESVVNKFQKFDFSLTELFEGLTFAIDMFEYNEIKSGEPTVVKTVTQEYRREASVRPKQGGNSMGCKLCNGDHNVFNCKRYRNRDAIRDQMKRLNLCFNCLSTKHTSKECGSRFNCKNCQGRHHTLICHVPGPNPTNHPNVVRANTNQPSQVDRGSASNNTPTPEPIATSSNQAVGAQPGSHSNLVVSQSSCSVGGDLPSAVLPTVGVRVSNNRKAGYTNMLIDTGSQKSFISTNLARRLNLKPIKCINVRLSTFGGSGECQTLEVVRVKINVGHHQFTAQFIVHDNVTMKVHQAGILQMRQKLVQHNVKLADKHLNSETIDNIEILLGIDYYSKVVFSMRRVCGMDLFVTAKGIVPFGIVPNWVKGIRTQDKVVCNRVTCIDSREERFSESHLWDLETIGIKDERFTSSEKQAIHQVTNNLVKTDEGYQVSLPFKDHQRPSVNYRPAIAQFNSLLQKFKTNVTLYEQYQKVIQDYLDQGFIEQTENDPRIGSYLPHHPVFKESKTTPLRIVFNASSKTAGGKSLNDCMYVGPSLTQKLHDALVQFRQNPVAVVSDISKAFHRILIEPEHRKYVKFVWGSLDRYSIAAYQFKVVIFGACSSPYILQQVLETHLNQDNLEIKGLVNNFYVDNFCKTYLTADQAIIEKPMIDKVLLDASMPLQGWVSNSETFNDCFELERQQQVNVLGLNWEVSSDTFKLSASKRLPDKLLVGNLPKEMFYQFWLQSSILWVF